MKKSGLADSPFFAPPPAKAAAAAKVRVKKRPANPPSPVKTAPAERPPRHQATTIPSNHDATVSRYHDTIIETIRAAVKELGKEAATYRFTPEEKKALADLIYAYKGRGLKTSENQIARVGVNFVVEDYKVNGKSSVLGRVLKALNK